MDYSQLGTTPISEDAPAGQDVRYEPSFEALSKEIAKLGSPTAASEIDWQHVVDLSAGILEKESKHLQVASYLCYGLAKTAGIEGIAQGMTVLRGVTENFWDTLFPPKKRMKGRRGIIDWWDEKTTDFVQNMDPVTWKKERRDELLDNVKSLDSFLGENMEDAPLLRPLIRRIESAVLEEQIKAEPPPAPPAPEAAAEPATPEAPAGPEAAAPPSPETVAPKAQPATAPKARVAAPPLPVLDDSADAAKILDQGMTFLGQTAVALRKQNKFDPVAYRLNRVAAWTMVSHLPPADGGKTLLPPPDGQVVQSIQTLYTNGNWEALADTCESMVRSHLYWLDLSRYVTEAMERLGHSKVSDAIGAEVSLFVSRINGIDALGFSDGTPFADFETQEWLRQLGQSGGDATAAGPGAAADAAKQAINEKTAEALSLAKENKTDAALALLTAALGSASGEREKFLWKLAVCKLLISIKKTQVASSFIDDMLATIHTYQLETWEPDQAVEAFSLALTGLRLEKGEQHAEKIQSIIRKISVLDPVTALKFV